MNRLAVSIFLCLLTILTGCPKPEIRYVREPPPPHLVAKTLMPERGGDTIGDLIEWIVPLSGAIESCNADKKAIETWGLNGK